MEIMKKFGLSSIVKRGDMVLSLYLNTDPNTGMEKRDVWKIHLKNGLKNVEQHITAVDHEQEVKLFQLVKTKVDEKIDDMTLHLKRSIVLFATPNEVVIHQLQVPVENQIVWRELPVISQLEAIYSKYPRSGIVAIDHEQALLIDMELGELKEEVAYSLDVESGDWRRFQGVAASSMMAGSSTHTDKYERRMNENFTRQLKQFAHILDTQALKRGWQGVYLVGQPEMTRHLQQMLHTEVVKMIPRNLSSKTAHEVMAEVFKN